MRDALAKKSTLSAGIKLRSFLQRGHLVEVEFFDQSANIPCRRSTPRLLDVSEDDSADEYLPFTPENYLRLYLNTTDDAFFRVFRAETVAKRTRLLRNDGLDEWLTDTGLGFVRRDAEEVLENVMQWRFPSPPDTSDFVVVNSGGMAYRNGDRNISGRLDEIIWMMARRACDDSKFKKCIMKYLSVKTASRVHEQPAEPVRFIAPAHRVFSEISSLVYKRPDENIPFVQRFYSLEIMLALHNRQSPSVFSCDNDDEEMQR